MLAILYLGVGIIVGAVIMVGSESFDLAMGVGGGLALISAGVQGFRAVRMARQIQKSERK